MSFLHPTPPLLKICLLMLIAALVTGCTTRQVRTTDFTPVNLIEVDTPEEYLLDVNVVLFDPGLDLIDEEELVYAGTRSSESVWIATRLKETLDRSRAWGVTRVAPDTEFASDLLVTGKIVLSNGESMIVHVKAEDAIGNIWINDIYEESVSHYAYSSARIDKSDAFQGLYNQISNDLLTKLLELSPDQRLAIRSVSDLKFAQAFAPDAFSQHLQKNDDGLYRIDRLPAENDPILQRIHQIEVRDQMFQDVLQDYYTTFTLQMDEPYSLWRQQSYIQTLTIQDLERSARINKIAGFASIILGVVAATQGENENTQNAGVIGISAGALAIQSGFRQSDEALIHTAALQEMSSALESELEPSVITLQDRTVTLSGTVREQYQQWQEILRDIYLKETGYSESMQGENQDTIFTESTSNEANI